MLKTASYANYKAAHRDETFTDWLVKSAGPLWSRAIEHPFTSAVGNDTVSTEVFTRYMLEDYHYIQDLASALGFLIAKAPTMAAKARLADFASHVTCEELDYFVRTFKELGVEPEVYLNTKPNTVTRAIGATLLSTAGKGHYVDGMATLLASEWIYREWGMREALKPRPERAYLAELLGVLSTDELGAFIDWVKQEVNTIGEEEREKRQSEISESFTHMCELEAEFFDMVS
ncbi:Thiaminase-2 [Pseudovibrio axinellae]|uniref:Aminopyrimidine aminohydrolase n=1 Tax=Pseudovibrio axinellae TaxID=989403 RepID=A0A166A5U9_9HYPH|nr:TenA family protein [Pseudovibrio axinellae]KZL20652.1 Thiaminase-2 [Pseudovibrio axinellae]SER26749.1 thiaminase (transcriptional activator TenA) [Pseudovibrio axinellae]